MLKHNKKSGFSFIELMVAIAILAVLLAVLAPSLLSYVENSRMQKDDSTMEEVVNAVQLAITDSATFDEVYSYCIPNNYVTYTDSSGKYANRTMDEEFWAPDGSGAAVTITFNPENGKYNISEGIVNDMTFGNGSVAEKRTAEGVQQCYLYEMGKSLLYSSVKQTIGNSVKERSATYKNSSYTVFIRFKTVDGTRQADVYGLFNGTNLSEGCPAAIGSNTSSYDEENNPISTTPSGGHQNSSFTNTDLTGGGSLGGFDPSKPLPTYRQCKKGHTFDPTNPVLSERCKCLVCFVIEHKFCETGTTLKCERCGYAKEHECNGNPCPLCGAIPFTVTAGNRDKVGFTGEEGENLVIPEHLVDVDGQRYRVVAIGGAAFTSCDKLTKVTLPNSVSRIGAYAFQNCKNLSSINIPDGVTDIAGSTFQNCNSLATISLPNSITRIGGYAFSGCPLPSIEIPDSVTAIDGGAFQGCSQLSNITLSKSLTAISHNTFRDCINLSSINIPDGVTSIGYDAFMGCTSLTNVIIHNNVKNIQYRAFSDCTNLTTITLPDTMNSLGWGIFNNCTNLQNIRIPNGINKINGGTFQNCSSLTNVHVPDDVTYIGSYSFSGCSSLESVNIPNGVTVIEKNTFSNCSSLTSIIIPDGVTSIGLQAFSYCTNISDISIPNTVTTIEDMAFVHCYNLRELTLSDNITTMKNGVFNCCYKLESVNIPNGITKIDNNLFSSCNRLSNITIPNGVTSIGNAAFSGTAIAKLTIPDNVTYVGDTAFQYCSNLVEINIPVGVTEINNRTFYACTRLTNIYFSGTTEQWNLITKGDEWKEMVHSSCIVHCTDGEIAIADA